MPDLESGHCCFYESGIKHCSVATIFSASMAVIRPPDGNMADYLKSLERLLEFNIRLVLPGHGPLVATPEAKIKEYIEHRMMQEKQVLDALNKGRNPIGGIIEMISLGFPTLQRSRSYRSSTLGG